jgi:hypothetical protein
VTTETRELDEDESSVPLSPGKWAPDPLPIEAGKAKKTQDNNRPGLKYINWFLEEQNLPLFDNLTHKDVEADHLQNFIDNNMHCGWRLLNLKHQWVDLILFQKSSTSATSRCFGNTNFLKVICGK